MDDTKPHENKDLEEDYDIKQPSTFEDSDEDDSTILEGSFAPMAFDVSGRRIQDLNNDYASRELDARPAFQRGYVWDRVKASRLIESVLLNVPLPLIYTAEETNGSEVVIDGQQRLLTFFGFISGKFPRDEKDFKLTKLKLLKQYNNQGWADLDKDTQRIFLKYVVQVIKISSKSHPNVKFEIFERLNSGSVKLNAQELRNCVYRGPFNELLRELAKDNNFRKCIGSSQAFDRMQDAELALRFLAFFERTYLHYPGGMKSFLNDFMDENKNLDAKKAELDRVQISRRAILYCFWKQCISQVLVRQRFESCWALGT